MADSDADYKRTLAEYLSRRTAHVHAGFVLSALRPNARVLDCGCGPGSITCELAELVTAGEVVGIDSNPSHVEQARHRATTAGLTNARFEVGSVYQLPYGPGSFDVVFAHALFQHLAEPERAISEARRVLTPAGVLALRTPDWSGLLLYPDDPDVRQGVRRFIELHYPNGPVAGRAHRAQLLRAGFIDVRFTASYECSDPTEMGRNLAEYLARHGEGELSAAMGRWATAEGAVFAQAWCEVVGVRGTS